MKKILFLAAAALLLVSCAEKPAPVTTRFETLPQWEQADGGFATTLDVPEVHSARYLVFDGAVPAEGIRVNGRSVKAAAPGVAPSVVPLSGWLSFGANTLSVEAPAFPGPARLLEGRRIYFSPEFYGVCRIHAFCTDVRDSSATLYVKAWLRNADPLRRQDDVDIVLKDADGIPVASGRQTLSIPSHKTERLMYALTLPHPHLWNGREDPYLYTLEAATGTDRVSVQVGIRTIERQGSALLLNGQPVVEEEGRFVEIDAYPLTHTLLSEYDREGILVRICAPAEDASARMPALMTEFAVHPCVAEWTTQDARRYPVLRMHDPYRPLLYRP